jgi:hypothetical protein
MIFRRILPMADSNLHPANIKYYLLLSGILSAIMTENRYALEKRSVFADL